MSTSAPSSAALRARRCIGSAGFPRDGEDDLTGELRGLLIRTVAILGDDNEVQAKARALYQQSLDDPARSPRRSRARRSPSLRRQATRPTMTTCSGLRDVDQPAGPAPSPLCARGLRFGGADGPHLRAHAHRPGAQPERAVLSLSRCMRNRDHGEQAWHFVARNWTTLNERFPSTSIIRMVEGIRMLMRPEQASEVQAFFSERGVRRRRRRCSSSSSASRSTRPSGVVRPSRSLHRCADDGRRR